MRSGPLSGQPFGVSAIVASECRIYRERTPTRAAATTTVDEEYQESRDNNERAPRSVSRAFSRDSRCCATPPCVPIVPKSLFARRSPDMTRHCADERVHVDSFHVNDVKMSVSTRKRHGKERRRGLSSAENLAGIIASVYRDSRERDTSELAGESISWHLESHARGVSEEKRGKFENSSHDERGDK